MRLGIINAELGICGIDSIEDLGAIQEERIKAQMPENTCLGDLAFFYMYDRDWIVINRSHALHEPYTEIIQSYLGMSEEERRKLYIQTPTNIKGALRILDGIISRRALIYRAIKGTA